MRHEFTRQEAQVDHLGMIEQVRQWLEVFVDSLVGDD
jgi:hypothetical protein